MRSAGLFSTCVATTTLMILWAPILGGQEKGQEGAQDLLQVCGKNCTVQFENIDVRVIEVVMKKGSKLTMHIHRCPFLWLARGPGEVKVTSPDGTSETLAVKANQAQFSNAVTHAMENVGSTDWRSVVAEQKCAPATPERR